jgi:hypothetical protein
MHKNFHFKSSGVKTLVFYTTLYHWFNLARQNEYPPGQAVRTGAGKPEEPAVGENCHSRDLLSGNLVLLFFRITIFTSPTSILAG